MKNETVSRLKHAFQLSISGFVLAGITAGLCVVDTLPEPARDKDVRLYVTAAQDAAVKSGGISDAALGKAFRATLLARPTGIDTPVQLTLPTAAPAASSPS